MRKTVLMILCTLGAVLVLSSCITQSMIVKAVRSNFARNEPTALLPDYPQKLEKVNIYRNLEYPTAYENATMDIIVPREGTGSLPVIFWVHGGAFIAGDKSGVEEYLVELANHGYVAVNINYALAPEYKYPTPVIQVGEAYTYMESIADEYRIDMEKVYFAGDSAGAQIVAQFVTIQTHREYAQAAGLTPVVKEPAAIAGALLFCGPYDITKIARADNPDVVKLYTFIAESYLGRKDWQDSPEAQMASIVDKVSESFPPAFITDGTEFSFPEHARELYAALQEKGVDSILVMYPDAALPHEYQFTMTSEYAQKTFAELVAFLKRTS